MHYIYLCTYLCMHVCSVVSDSATLWTVACQAPLTMGCPGKNTLACCHFLLQGSRKILREKYSEKNTQGDSWSGIYISCALQVDSLPLSHQGSHFCYALKIYLSYISSWIYLVFLPTFSQNKTQFVPVRYNSTCRK